MQTVANAEDTIPRLFKAIESGNVDNVRELIGDNPKLVSARNKDGASALIWATYYRAKPIYELLLSRGIKPDIFEASALGLTERVADLVRADRGLVDRYSFDGWTPLHLAAHFGRVEAMRVLLSNGADHRTISRNSNRNQPLQAAAANRQTEAVELLLKAGAEVDARSHGGFTALHIAAANGVPRMVEDLLAAGADPKAKTEGGKSPADFAVEGDHSEVVDLLDRATDPERWAGTVQKFFRAELSSLNTFSKYWRVPLRTSSSDDPCRWKSPTTMTFVFAPIGT
jgi:uncharacterized protein